MTGKNNQAKSEMPAADPRWRDLYRLGGIAAAAGVALIALGVAAYIIWPYSAHTATAEKIFLQLQTDRLGGWMALDLPYFLGNLAGIPLFLGLYAGLRRTNESLALTALVLGIAGVVLLLAARPIVEVTLLADKYAAAASEAERGRYLAAGEALLPLFTGTYYYLHYFLGTLSLLISAFLMLRGSVFPKAAAWVGIATNTVAFGLYLPVIGLPLAFLSLVGLVIWDIQIASTLFRLARGA